MKSLLQQIFKTFAKLILVYSLLISSVLPQCPSDLAQIIRDAGTRANLPDDQINAIINSFGPEDLVRLRREMVSYRSAPLRKNIRRQAYLYHNGDESVPMTNGLARRRALRIDESFKEIPMNRFPADTHNQIVFCRKNGYPHCISIDIDCHTDCGWKGFTRDGTRVGTYTRNLKRRIRN